jgi:hypothetical protein
MPIHHHHLKTHTGSKHQTVYEGKKTPRSEVSVAVLLRIQAFGDSDVSNLEDEGITFS